MKKLIAIMLAAVSVVSVTACGKKDTKTEYDKYNYNLAEYMVIPDYKDIEVKTYDVEVTDEDIAQQVLQCRLQFAEATEVTDRAAKTLDKVNIDYTGYMDGEVYASGTSSNQELVLGSGSYIAGFEDGLLGAMPGNTVTLDLRFPTPYISNPDLSGKEITFVVTVNKIYELTIPEYNDAFVSSNYKYSTTADFEAAIRTSLESSYASSKKKYEVNQAWDYIVENTEIREYPEKEYEEIYASWLEYYDYYAEKNNISLENYVVSKLSYKNYDEFLSDVEANTKDEVKEMMILYYIARKENISVDEEEYQTKALQYAQYYGLSTVEALEAYYDRDTLMESFLFDKVMEYLASVAKKVAI